MEQNLMDLINLDKADGWDCFDTTDELQRNLAFDWDTFFVDTFAGLREPAKTERETAGRVVCVSAPERFARENDALREAGCTVQTASCNRRTWPEILLGGREVFQLLDTIKPSLGVVIDLCGGESDESLAKKVTEQPNETLIGCVSAAESLRDCKVLLLADSCLWGRTQAMMIYAAAKQAKLLVKIAILQPWAVSKERLAQRRCQIVTDWVLRQFIQGEKENSEMEGRANEIYCKANVVMPGCHRDAAECISCRSGGG